MSVFCPTSGCGSCYGQSVQGWACHILLSTRIHMEGDLCVITHNIAMTLRQLYLPTIRTKAKWSFFTNSSCMKWGKKATQKRPPQMPNTVQYGEYWSSNKVNATQDSVRRILKAIDPSGVSLRSIHRLRWQTHINKGPNHIIHIDGYGKLKPFDITIQGAIDGHSRKVLWLQNNFPKRVVRYHLNYIKTIRHVPIIFRADLGTENCVIRDLQIALRYNHGDLISGR